MFMRLMQVVGSLSWLIQNMSGPDKTIDADRIITRAISLNPISGLITQRRQAGTEA